MMSCSTTEAWVLLKDMLTLSPSLFPTYQTNSMTFQIETRSLTQPYTLNDNNVNTQTYKKNIGLVKIIQSCCWNLALPN